MPVPLQDAAAIAMVSYKKFDLSKGVSRRNKTNA